MCSVWRAEFEVLAETTKLQDLRPLHRLFSLFHRVYRPQDPACLHMLARVCGALSAVHGNRLLFTSCTGEELDRACLHVSRICTAILRSLQHQGCALLLCLLCTTTYTPILLLEGDGLHFH